MLNAMLGDKFSEVSIRRTTAGISRFRVFKRTPTNKDEIKGGDNSVDRSTVSDDLSTADATLKQTTEDNASLRGTDKISVKTFDIQVEEDLVPMRSDTNLTW